MIDGLAYADQQIAERKRRAALSRARHSRDRALFAARRTAGLTARHTRKTRRTES